MSYEEPAPAPHGGRSPLSIVLIAILVLLLGLGGAIFGIYAANHRKVAASPSPTAVVTSSTASGTAAPTTPVAPTTTGAAPSPSNPPDQATPPVAGIVVPDLSGMDFEAARTKVRDLRLGWRLVFEGTDPPSHIVRTSEPAPGSTVGRGSTVKILVAGAAPLATVPGVVGLGCAQAAALIIDHGLYPQYATGRSGLVRTQVPASTDPQTTHWNDQVTIGCG